jgi:hypothetical protein
VSRHRQQPTGERWRFRRILSRELVAALVILLVVLGFISVVFGWWG